jgi:phenylpropionate dioxygenase-like ring-hydroxylating dioxygenase large terminal subunit
MNIEKLKGYWYPVMASQSLKNSPKSVTLLGEKLVLFRSNGKVSCLKNQCPHRGVALSNGKVENNQLKCHYHGWSFNADGHLCNVPGCTNGCHKDIGITTFAVIEEDDTIWIRLQGNMEFKSPFILNDGFIHTRHFKKIEANFIHAIENFLDATHTPFIHKGLLRSNGKQRMKITQESFENGFVTYYDLIDKQNGLINKLFDKGINKNRASFSLPSFAKLEYLKDDELLFCVAIFFVPFDKGEVGMVVDVSLPKQKLPKKIVFAMLRPFLELAFYQDKTILNEQYKKSGKEFAYLSLESDLVIDHLLYFLAGDKKGINKEMIMEL